MQAVNSPILEMQGITKQFPGVLALSAVNLEVHHGEVVALVGENGAGKSTLMNILGGVCTPDEGIVRIDGKPVMIVSVADANRLGIGFIHQELTILENLDVAANIFLAREPLWGGPLKLIDRREMNAQADPYLRRLGLEISSQVSLSRLSIGQQQMVEIAKALAQDARILIMDEPTSSLALSETERLLQVVRDLRTQGVSIIYITHRLGEIKDCADRVVVLRDGRNAGGLNRDEITHDTMVRMMVGRDLQDFYVHPRTETQPKYFEINDLRTVTYPDQAVSFSIGKGEILGVAGLVGAGRSEVARAIFGVDPVLAGTFCENGKPVSISSPAEAIDNGIYLIPEDRRKSGLITEMTIRENVSLPALSTHATFGLIHQDSERRLAESQCAARQIRPPDVETKVAHLSGGNQQKVVLSKWLSMKPKMIILDEPTRGIDVGAKAEVYKLIRDLAENGVAIMIISSDMEEILGVCDRVMVMHEGAISGILGRNELSEEAVLGLAVGQPKRTSLPADSPD